MDPLLFHVVHESLSAIALGTMGFCVLIALSWFLTCPKPSSELPVWERDRRFRLLVALLMAFAVAGIVAAVTDAAGDVCPLEYHR